MARQPRFSQEGASFHVCQRGHGGMAFVRDEQDRQAYLHDFFDAASGLGLQIHAWALTDLEAHWLVTPLRAKALSEVPQQMGRRYVRRFNARWQGRGSVWDGRFRSYWVGQAETLALSIWLEQRLGLGAEAASNGLWMGHALGTGAPGPEADPIPVRSASLLAGLIPVPTGRFWGAFRPCPAYWALGNTPFDRELAYRRLLAQPSPAALDQRVQRGLGQGVPLLSEAEWLAQPEAVQALRLQRPRGRPRRAE